MAKKPKKNNKKRKTGMKSGHKLIAIVVGVLVLGAAAIGLFLLIFPPPPPIDPRIAHCYRLLPETRAGGVSVKFDKEGIAEIVLGGEWEGGKDPKSEQLKAFQVCVNEALNMPVRIRDGATIDLEPLGQVADRWKSESGLKLTLMPGPKEEVLQNLRIGPLVGLKPDMISEWCGGAVAGTCVSCEPDTPTMDTPAVIIRLRSEAPAIRAQMPGNWPPVVIDPETGKLKLKADGQPVTPFKPWQLVDAEGRRFFYECRPSG